MSQEDMAQIMEAAIDRACDKWTFFNKALPFREDVSLRDRIKAFYVPFATGVRQIKGLETIPDEVLIPVVALGIQKAGTHTYDQLAEALGPDMRNL